MTTSDKFDGVQICPFYSIDAACSSRKGPHTKSKHHEKYYLPFLLGLETCDKVSPNVDEAKRLIDFLKHHITKIKQIKDKRIKSKLKCFEAIVLWETIDHKRAQLNNNNDQICKKNQNKNDLNQKATTSSSSNCKSNSNCNPNAKSKSKRHNCNIDNANYSKSNDNSSGVSYSDIDSCSESYSQDSEQMSGEDMSISVDDIDGMSHGSVNSNFSKSNDKSKNKSNVNGGNKNKNNNNNNFNHNNKNNKSNSDTTSILGDGYNHNHNSKCNYNCKSSDADQSSLVKCANLFKRAIELDDKNCLAQFKYGALLEYEFQKYEEAVVHYQKAAELVEENASLLDESTTDHLYFCLASCLNCDRIGKSGEAIKYFNKMKWEYTNEDWIGYAIEYLDALAHVDELTTIERIINDIKNSGYEIQNDGNRERINSFEIFVNTYIDIAKKLTTLYDDEKDNNIDLAKAVLSEISPEMVLVSVKQNIVSINKLIECIRSTMEMQQRRSRNHKNNCKNKNNNEFCNINSNIDIEERKEEFMNTLTEMWSILTNGFGVSERVLIERVGAKYKEKTNSSNRNDNSRSNLTQDTRAQVNISTDHNNVKTNANLSTIKQSGTRDGTNRNRNINFNRNKNRSRNRNTNTNGGGSKNRMAETTRARSNSNSNSNDNDRYRSKKLDKSTPSSNVTMTLAVPRKRRKQKNNSININSSLNYISNNTSNCNSNTTSNPKSSSKQNIATCTHGVTVSVEKENITSNKKTKSRNINKVKVQVQRSGCLNEYGDCKVDIDHKQRYNEWASSLVPHLNSWSLIQDAVKKDIAQNDVKYRDTMKIIEVNFSSLKKSLKQILSQGQQNVGSVQVCFKQIHNFVKILYM